jgi:Family of unknown function (DUF5754)
MYLLSDKPNSIEEITKWYDSPDAFVSDISNLLDTSKTKQFKGYKKGGKRLKLHSGGSLKHNNKAPDSFEGKFNTKLSKDIEEAHKPRLKLKSGGSLKDSLLCNKPKRAAAGKSQKYTVKGCTGTGDNKKEKLLHFGLRGMQDFLQHKDKDRRKNFRSRMNCDTANDKLTRRFWVCNHNW